MPPQQITTLHDTTVNGQHPVVQVSDEERSNHKTQEGVVPLPTRMLLSAIAGMGAVNVCHPLDVIRVQMQVNTTKNSSWQTAKTIYAKAGITNGLYAGISAAYLRQILYGSCRMGIYSYLMEQAKQEKDNHATIPLQQKLKMGCISGSIGSLVGTPAEVALVRMSADSRLPLEQQRKYSSVVDCLKRIVQEEGVRQLWRGATPTVARATLLSACSLGITSEVKETLTSSGYFGQNGQWLHGYPVLFVATTVSSFFANLVSNPFDCMKSRLQNMPVAANGSAMYSGLGDCFVKSIRADGVWVLWKGFTPAFIKLAPYSIISLTLLDKLTQAIIGKDAL